MYHTIIQRKLRFAFDQLSTGNYGTILAGMAPKFDHRFSGTHALGGRRTSPEGYRRWFERFVRIFPRLQFEIRNIVVSGWPWNTIAAVEWLDRIQTDDGNQYENAGVHIIRLKWTKVTEIRIYCDTQKLAAVCEVQARCGREDALGPPITD